MAVNLNEGQIREVLNNVYDALPKTGLAELLETLLNQNMALRQEIESLKMGLVGPSQGMPETGGKSMGGSSPFQ